MLNCGIAPYIIVMLTNSLPLPVLTIPSLELEVNSLINWRSLYDALCFWGLACVTRVIKLLPITPTLCIHKCPRCQKVKVNRKNNMGYLPTVYTTEGYWTYINSSSTITTSLRNVSPALQSLASISLVVAPPKSLKTTVYNRPCIESYFYCLMMVDFILVRCAGLPWQVPNSACELL